MVNAANIPPPSIFVFGDSTVDVGTNNLLIKSEARANILPNGIDYPYAIPTGRFSNGLNSADQIARQFGISSSPPPFLSLLQDMSTFKKNILLGANFASGGSGVLDDTGDQRYKEVVPLGTQIQQFDTIRRNFSEIMGPEATVSTLSKSIFIVSVGSNDLFDYNQTTNTLSPQDYIINLQQTYHNHLQNLYNLGARKLGIVGVPPIGCCPAVRNALNLSGCVDLLNEFASGFNTQLEILLHDMSTALPDMKYALGNSYEMTLDIINNPLAFGINEINSACCGQGDLNGASPCIDIYKPNLCMNRDQYLFWDMFHPTERAAGIAALTFYGGGTKYVTPMNFSQLASTF
jgi:phospholipase/lecithinase/hemolysin